MDEIQKMKRSKWSHFIEVVSYIVYTVSVYYVSHLDLKNEVFIDDRYRVFCFCFITSTFLYFKSESLEIFKEMIKSGCILISCQCIDAFFYAKGTDLETFMYIIVSQVVWQLLSFVFAYIYNSNMKEHGKYTNRLLVICLAVLFVSTVLIKLNVFICIMIFAGVYFVFGYRYYIRNMKERKKEKAKAEEVKQNMLKAEREKEQEKKELIEKNIALNEENKKLKAQLQLINKKNRRKKVKK